MRFFLKSAPAASESNPSLQPRPRESCLRTLLQLLLMVPKESNACSDQAYCRDQQQKANRPSHTFDFLTEQIGTTTEQYGPTNSTERIHDQKMRPVHPIGAGEESGVGPKKSHESPKKDDFAAVPQKQILTDLEPRLIETNVFAVSRKQADTNRTTNQVANVIADDGCRSRDEHNGGDANLVRRPGIDGSRHHGGLARHGDSHAFQHNCPKEHPKPVSLDQVLYPRCRKNIHS